MCTPSINNEYRYSNLRSEINNSEGDQLIDEEQNSSSNLHLTEAFNFWNMSANLQQLQKFGTKSFKKVASFFSSKEKPSHLLKSPLEIVTNIFLFLSHKELCRLNSTCKAIQAIANNEEIWEELCQKEDYQLSKKKILSVAWKDFYKDEIALVKYKTGEQLTEILVMKKDPMPGYRAAAMFVSINLASQPKGIHLKKIIAQMAPSFLSDTKTGALVIDDDVYLVKKSKTQ